MVVLDVLLACFYGRGGVRVLEGTQNIGADPQLPSQLLKLMVLRE